MNFISATGKDSAAAAETTEIAAATADKVSGQIAALFGAHALRYQSAAATAPAPALVLSTPASAWPAPTGHHCGLRLDGLDAGRHPGLLR
ncbi:PE domain-containing protein [Mycobacterium simiae]|uniref:PE domain-containing protein n=1 Tax=Mycobacterium simiae TaxID=1784 RepID=A0A5B1BM27_MYCSI|nr:PE family protein [Mycobacterium simiae]KAA1248264.1 PE domain-containing protein [Mycobacterium simiae]